MNIHDVKTIKAMSLLNEYKGKNPYIKRLKDEYLNDRLSITNTQAKYVIDHVEKEPILINRVINITEYYGEQLKTDHKLPFIPERILFQFILGETEKAFHVYGKLSRGQKKSSMYWVPKTQVLDDPYWEEPNVDVDFQKYIDMDITGRKPYDHQITGVKFLLCRDGAILADEMGTGKTYMSTIAALESEAKRVLVICPASLKTNWKREIEMFGVDDVSIINSVNWDPSKFTIINFEILKNFHTLKKDIKKGEEHLALRKLVEENFDLVIVDEAHNLKNHKSARGMIVDEVVNAFGVEKVWLLTGTPIANRPMDFYNLLKLIKSPIVKNLRHFVLRYCDGKIFWKKMKNGKKRQIWLTDGSSNLKELGSRTRNLILRRKKIDLLDLPEKRLNCVHHEFDDKQKEKYDNLWEEYLEERKKAKKRGKVERSLVEIGLLRQFIATETIPKTIDIVENMLEEDRKVIIFTNFNEEQDLLYKHFSKIAVRHNGSMNNKNKQSSIDRFQSDNKIKLFIGNVESAGVGITLTEASVVVFNSLHWVPGNILQAIDRCHRIGQKNDIDIFFNIYKDTLDERIWASLFKKNNVIETILESEHDDNIFKEIEDKVPDWDEVVDDIINN